MLYSRFYWILLDSIMSNLSVKYYPTFKRCVQTEHKANFKATQSQWRDVSENT